MKNPSAAMTLEKMRRRKRLWKAVRGEAEAPYDSPLPCFKKKITRRFKPQGDGDEGDLWGGRDCCPYIDTHLPSTHCND